MKLKVAKVTSPCPTGHSTTSGWFPSASHTLPPCSGPVATVRRATPGSDAARGSVVVPWASIGKRDAGNPCQLGDEPPVPSKRLPPALT